MKTDDIFEAITDIDDKFLEEAQPTDFNDDRPVIARPAPRKPLWKTLVPIAACIAVLCAAGTLGVKYFKNRPRSETSEGSNASFSQLGASTQKVSRIEIPEDGSEVRFTMDEFPAFDFRASNNSVWSVLKTTPETDAVFENSLFLFHKNASVQNIYLADLNGDGKREICATVYEAEKGQSIMVCDFADGLNEEGTVVDTIANSLYSLPSMAWEYEYALAAEDGILKAVKTEWHLPPVSAAPKELSREPLTLDMMVRINASYEFKEVTVPLPGARNDFVMEEFPDYNFTATYEGVLLNAYMMNAVDVAIIRGDPMENLFLCDLNGDGRRELCATVVNDGVRSIDVIDFAANDKWYRLQGKAREEYYLEKEAYLDTGNEHLMSVFREDNGDCCLETHDPLSLDKMMLVLPGNDVTKIGDEEHFKLVEFPDKTFEIIDGKIVMDDINAPSGTMRNSVIGGIEYYLTDLNGDFKREICAWGSIGSGIDYRYIVVYDIANNESYYYKPPKALKELVSLDMEKDPLDDVLYVVTNEYYPDSDKEISREPLTLDILEKVSKSDNAYEDIPLFIDQTFTKEDFPGVKFTVDTSTEVLTFRFGWESSSIANNVNRVFLYDADGDGKREICLNCPFAGNGIIRVYGYMDDGEMGCAVYYEDGGCWLHEGENGTLNYYTNDKIEPFKFSKSDLKPTFAQSYSYEILDWDHTLDFSEIAPVFGTYNISIKDRTLKINGISADSENDVLFDSGAQLSELYTMYDKEERTLTFVFTCEVTGNVSALKVSERKTAEIYHYEKGVTLKPTKDELLIVNPDGSEEPFKFPENSDTLTLGE